jgi:L-cysteine S-thiosulfotransferase
MIRCVAVLVALTWSFAACAAEKRSGYEDARPETRAMQDDDGANPAFLWVKKGAALWQQRAGTAEKSCGDCHGDAAASMRGVSARYPAYDEKLGRPLTLEQRINQCRTERQGAPALAAESEPLLSLSAFVGLQSRGMPVDVSIDGPARPFFETGERWFKTRIGQLNLSCAQCHDDLAGERLAGNVIPQGHPNGYPLYRLEWQGLGSLQRRLRNCTTGVRAEPFAASDLTALELYLAWRANGLKVETPAVRP